jgi:hypothetical protein
MMATMTTWRKELRRVYLYPPSDLVEDSWRKMTTPKKKKTEAIASRRFLSTGRYFYSHGDDLYAMNAA